MGEDFADWAVVATAGGWRGRFLGEMELLGGRVGVFGEIDETEAARRRECGLDAVVDRGVLHALSSLPLGERVPWSAVSAIDWATLESAPEGAVELEPAGVTRLYAPVVNPTGVAKRAQGGGQALEHVSAFAAVCPRALVVFSRVATDPYVRRSATFGVGVVGVDESGSLVPVVPPASRNVRPGVFRWIVQEEIWSQVDHAKRVSRPGRKAPCAYDLVGEEGDESVLVRGEVNDATALAIAALVLEETDQKDQGDLVIARRGLWRKVPDRSGNFQWWLKEVESPRPGAFPAVMVEVR